jgi:hypothetical protein
MTGSEIAPHNSNPDTTLIIDFVMFVVNSFAKVR